MGDGSKQAIDPKSVKAIPKHGRKWLAEAGEFIRSWTKVVVSDRGYGAVASSVCATGFELLQQCHTTEQSRGTDAVNCFSVTLVLQQKLT